MTSSLCSLPLIVLLLITGSAARPARPYYPLPSKDTEDHKLPLQTSHPYNIAHRSSNGEFPEETAAAYMRAIEEGADFIEADILSSKDGILICFHDVTLDDTTNVADLKQFSNRKTTYEVQGVNTTGWFTVDFTFKELKLLRMKQRYLDYIKEYVVGIGPWKDTIVPVAENYLTMASDLVARAHACNLQVHPYTYRNENNFLHFNFHQDPYQEYDYWINQMGVDGLFTDFTGSLHEFQEWATPLYSKDDSASELLHKIVLMIQSYKGI